MFYPLFYVLFITASLIIGSLLAYLLYRTEETKSSIFIGLLTGFGFTFFLTVPIIYLAPKKIDTTNVTIIQGKKTIQLNAKDLKTISKGTLSLPNNQKAYCFDTIDIVNSGDTIDHLEYGTKTTYDDYLGDQIGKTSQKVLRIVLKPNEKHRHKQ